MSDFGASVSSKLLEAKSIDDRLDSKSLEQRNKVSLTLGTSATPEVTLQFPTQEMTTVDYENFVRGLPADQTAAERRASLNSINSSQSYHQKYTKIMEKKKEQRKSLRRESKRKTRLENELIMEEMERAISNESSANSRLSSKLTRLASKLSRDESKLERELSRVSQGSRSSRTSRNRRKSRISNFGF